MRVQQSGDGIADYFALCRSFCEQYGAAELDSRRL